MVNLVTVLEIVLGVLIALVLMAFLKSLLDKRQRAARREASFNSLPNNNNLPNNLPSNSGLAASQAARRGLGAFSAARARASARASANLAAAPSPNTPAANGNNSGNRR